MAKIYIGCVGCIYAYPPGMVNFVENYHGGILSILYVFIKRGIGSVAVPAFFFISGYLFYCKLEQWNQSIWVSKLRKRIQTILVPYIVWQLIAALFYCFILFVKQNSISQVADFCNDRRWILMFWNNGRFGESATFITNVLGMQMHNSAPIDGPLWFIRDLMVCMLFSPILYYLLKRYILVILSLLLIYNLWIPLEGFSIVSVFFFCWGGYFSKNRKLFLESFLRYQNVCHLLSTLLLIGIVLTYGNHNTLYKILWPAFTIVGVVSTIDIASYLLQKKLVSVHRNLSQSSFFIFASHFLLIMYVSRFMNSIIQDRGEIYCLITYLSSPVLLIIILECIYLLLLRKQKFILKYLTGGR